MTTKKRLVALFGGRGAGRTHSIARYILARACRENIRIWCAREKQNSIDQSVKHVFVELIHKFGLSDKFIITRDDIYCTETKAYFMFKGFRGDGGQYSTEGLKAYEDFDVLWIEEASACTMESLNVVSKTIRKEGSQIIASFNRVLEEDAIWRFACYDIGDIYNNKIFEDDKRLVIYATVDDNPYASDTFLEERETDRKRLTEEEFKRVWEGYPDGNAGFKAFFTRDMIYGEKREPEEWYYKQYEIVCGFDPNGGGKDSACAVARQGNKIIEIAIFRNIKEPLELAEKFLDFKNKYHSTKAYCDRGYGQGVLTLAAQRHDFISPVDFGGRAVDPEQYGNRRAEIYGRLKQWLIDGGYLGDSKDDKVVNLRRELQCIQYNLRKSDEGKIYLCSKDDIRKVLGHSTDIADALALTFSGSVDKVVRKKNGEAIESELVSSYVVQSMEDYDVSGGI